MVFAIKLDWCWLGPTLDTRPRRKTLQDAKEYNVRNGYVFPLSLRANLTDVLVRTVIPPPHRWKAA